MESEGFLFDKTKRNLSEMITARARSPITAPFCGEKKKAPRPWLRDERQPSAVPPRFGAVRRTPAGFNGPNPPVIGRTLQGEQSARFAGGFQPVASVLCCA